MIILVRGLRMTDEWTEVAADRVRRQDLDTTRGSRPRSGH